jgi:hypothetical protein
LDTPSLKGGGSDREGAPGEAPTQTEKDRLLHSRIEQQLDLDGAELTSMSTPMQWRSLTSDVLKETNNMALVTTKVVVKMNKLEEKLDQHRWQC